MKKVLFALILVVSVLFVMVSCTDNKGTGATPTTTESAPAPGSPVTNENGEIVTDENGNTVTTPSTPTAGGIQNGGANMEEGWGPIQR